jgi:methanogenic corrinoid protein MtbC1
MGKSYLWEQTAASIESQSTAIAKAAVAEQYQRQPEIWEKYGDKGRQLSERDAAYHLPFLCEALAGFEPRIWNEYVEWLQGLFANLKFPSEVLPAMITSFQKTLQEMLPSEQADCVHDILEKSLSHISVQSQVPKTHIDPTNPHVGLARAYLNFLLDGDRQQASRLIRDAAESGTPVRDIYLDVFQSAQREIGRLWYAGEINVAQEHYASAATQFIMAQLYPYVFSSEKINRRLVAACAQGELHEIGLRMVTDFFEIEGWDTYYLGANQPVSGLIQTLSMYETDVLAISASMMFHRRYVAEVIQQTKESGVGDSLRIIVGGYLFNQFPEMYKDLGADGYAHDAQDAIELVDSLLPKETA